MNFNTVLPYLKKGALIGFGLWFATYTRFSYVKNQDPQTGNIRWKFEYEGPLIGFMKSFNYDENKDTLDDNPSTE